MQIYGCDFKQKSAILNEECERELELQKELEEEIEIEIPLTNPHLEKDWSYYTAFKAQSVADVENLAFSSLEKFMEQKIPRLSSMKWLKREKVYLTENFWKTVQVSSNSSFEFYMRRADFLLVFPAGDLLFVSDREANALIEFAKKNSQSSSSLTLLNLPHARQVNEKVITSLGNFPFCANSSTTALMSLIVCHLFQGDSNFSEEYRQILLKSNWFDSEDSIAQSKSFLTLIGKETLFDGSDLCQVSNKHLTNKFFALGLEIRE
eukprot:Awhi_evm1s12996